MHAFVYLLHKDLRGLCPLRLRDSRLLWFRLNAEISSCTHGFQQPLICLICLVVVLTGVSEWRMRMNVEDNEEEDHDEDGDGDDEEDLTSGDSPLLSSERPSPSLPRFWR